jgi:HEAT repeat protein
MGLEEAILQLSSMDECDRIDAAEDIGLAARSEGVHPLFQRVIQEPSRAVREAIFAALALIPDEAVIQQATQLLSHDDPGLRNQALELLQTRGSAVLPEVRRLLMAADRNLRKFAVDLLSHHDSREIEELLEIALRDKDPNVVITALENVRHCHTPELRRVVLQHALSGVHPMLVLAAWEALGRIGDAECYRQIRARFPTLKNTPLLYLRPALKLLSANGKNGDLLELGNFLTNCAPDLRPAVLDALHCLLVRLGAAGVPDVLGRDLLARLPETTVSAERYQSLILLGHFGRCTQVTQTLVSYLQSPSKVDRLGAIEALGKQQNEDIHAALDSRLQVEIDPEVRQAIEEVLRVNRK